MEDIVANRMTIVVQVNDGLKGYFQIDLDVKDCGENVDENVKHGLFDCVVNSLIVGANNEMVLGNHICCKSSSHVGLVRDDEMDLERLVVVLFGIYVLRDIARTRRRLVVAVAMAAVAGRSMAAAIVVARVLGWDFLILCGCCEAVQ